MNESIWRTATRALFTTFAKVAGFLTALFLAIYVISSIEEQEDNITNNYSTEILPNAEGVRKRQSKSSPVILQIDVHGEIGGKGLEQKDIENILIESRENSLKNDRVKAIFLNINTPGGGAIDSDGIYRALLNYKAQHKTPIYAFVDGICASGGMYVACAADKIFATDSSIIGSIGVISSPFMNFSKTMEKVGIDSLTIYSGKGKDDLNPFRQWKEGEATNFKEVIEGSYQLFVSIVSKHRPKLTQEKLVKDLGANIFLAKQALELGYIDEITTSRNAALKELLAALSIEDDYYQIMRLESTNWLSQLTRSESPVLTGKIKHQLPMTQEIPEKLLYQPLYLYRP